MQDLADAFESLCDYPTAFRWRWQAMWRRTTEDKYHLLAPNRLRRIWPAFFTREVTAAFIARTDPQCMTSVKSTADCRYTGKKVFNRDRGMR